MKKQVLIVEDESIVAMEINAFITQLGYEVIGIVNTIEKACNVIKTHCPFVVLMDITLGRDDGIEGAQQLQQQCQSAIIYLTAYSDEATIERAAQTHPSGYLIKPFNRKELAAALRIAYIRYQSQPIISRGDVILDTDYTYESQSGELYCLGECVHLTRREQELLALLMRHSHATVDLYTIENTIWPEKAPNENTRRALVSRLRAKLGQRFIETVSGVGYRITF
jgi:DNA-binding response OmpR family regulator